LQTLRSASSMSALPSKADILHHGCQKQTWSRQRAQSLDAGFDHDRRREQDAAVMIPLLFCGLLRADTLATDRTAIRRADSDNKGRSRQAGLAIMQAKPSTPY
jgi:hypothetical protein